MPSILPTTLYVLHLASPYAYKKTRVGNGEVSGSLPTPEFPKQQRVKRWEKSDNPKKNQLRRFFLSWSFRIPAVGEGSELCVFFPEENMARGFQVSTHLSSLVVTLSGLWGERHLNTTLLQLQRLTSWEEQLLSVSSVSYSAAGLV